MLSKESKLVTERAKTLYDEKYRATLEKSNHGAFVCIEPESGEYFLGATLDEAVNQAIDVYPDRLTHTLRIGHAAALHLGLVRQRVSYASRRQRGSTSVARNHAAGRARFSGQLQA